MKPDQTKARLSAARQQLIELMQQMNFGRIENLTVREGDPVLDPMPRVIHEIKFGGDNGPRPERRAEDFLLKAQVVELLGYLDHVWGGRIDLLEIKHGLPFRMLLAEGGA